MSATTLTAGQRLVLDVLTDEPRPPIEIAREAGLIGSRTRDHLAALNAKGLVRKHLNPTRWSSGRAGRTTDMGAGDKPGSPAARRAA